MFYFKDDPVAPSALDVEQFAKVAAFKNRLAQEGVLYWTFTRSLDSTVRIHLARQIQEWVAEPDRSPTTTEPLPPNSVLSAEDEEPGVFDCMEAFMRQFQTFGEARARAIAAIFELHEKLLGGQQDGSEPDQPFQRKTLNWMADLLDAMVVRLRTETPLMNEAFQAAMDSLGKTLALADELGFAENVNTAPLHEGVATALGTLKEDLEFLEQFRSTIAGTPRLTTQLNRAKRRALEAIEELSNAIQYEHDTLKQIVDTLGPPQDTA